MPTRVFRSRSTFDTPQFDLRLGMVAKRVIQMLLLLCCRLFGGLPNPSLREQKLCCVVVDQPARVQATLKLFVLR